MPGPARSFTVHDVVRAALDCLDEGGFDRLSVRSTATALGVTPNALYTYVRDRAALLALLQEAALEPVATAAGPEGATPRDRLRAMAGRMWDAFATTRNRVPLLLAAPLSGANALSIGEQLLRAFLDAGLHPDDAARASYAFQVQVIGFLLLRAADDDVEHPAADPTQAPLTATSAEVVAGYGGRPQYDWAVERLLGGLLSGEPTGA